MPQRTVLMNLFNTLLYFSLLKGYHHERSINYFQGLNNNGIEADWTLSLYSDVSLARILLSSCGRPLLSCISVLCCPDCLVLAFLPQQLVLAVLLDSLVSAVLPDCLVPAVLSQLYLSSCSAPAFLSPALLSPLSCLLSCVWSSCSLGSVQGTCM